MLPFEWVGNASRTSAAEKVTCPCRSLFLIRSSMLICHFCCKGKQKVLSIFSIFGTKLPLFNYIHKFLDNKIKIFLTFLHFYTFFYSLVLHICTFSKQPKDFFFPPLIRCSLPLRSIDCCASLMSLSLLRKISL